MKQGGGVDYKRQNVHFNKLVRRKSLPAELMPAGGEGRVLEQWKQPVQRGSRVRAVSEQGWDGS